jgi:hypothetical protein
MGAGSSPAFSPKCTRASGYHVVSSCPMMTYAGACPSVVDPWTARFAQASREGCTTRATVSAAGTPVRTSRYSRRRPGVGGITSARGIPAVLIGTAEGTDGAARPVGTEGSADARAAGAVPATGAGDSSGARVSAGLPESAAAASGAMLSPSDAPFPLEVVPADQSGELVHAAANKTIPTSKETARMIRVSGIIATTFFYSCCPIVPVHTQIATAYTN